MEIGRQIGWFIFLVGWLMLTACTPAIDPISVTRLTLESATSTTSTVILPTAPAATEPLSVQSSDSVRQTPMATPVPTSTPTWTATPIPNASPTSSAIVAAVVPSPTPLITEVPVVQAQIIDQIGGYTGAVAVRGSYLFLGVGLRVLILDISLPAQPRLIGRSEILSGVPLTLIVTETKAYLGLDNGYLTILDVTNLAEPRLMGSFVEASHAGGTGATVQMTLAEHFIYLVDEMQKNLSVIDVTNPMQPVRIAEHVLANASVQDVVVWGNMVYVAMARGGVLMFELTAAHELLERGQLAFQATNIAVAENLAYLVDGDQTLQIYDLTNPQQPLPLGTYQTDEMSVANVTAVDQTVYISDQTGTIGTSRIFFQYGPPARPGNVQIIDASDPANPQQAGSFTTPLPIWSLAADENYLYVTDGDLLIVDVGETAVPTVVGRYQTPGEIYDLVVEGNDLYGAAGNRGLRLFDVSDTANLAAAGFQIGTPGHAVRLAVNDDYAYVTNDFRVGLFADSAVAGLGIRIVNVATPQSPDEINFYSISREDPYALNDMTMAGDYIYLAQGDGLHIVDVSDPSHLREVSVIETPARGVAVAGRYAFVTGNDGLQILDVANPTSPITISTGYVGYGLLETQDSYFTHQIAVVGGHAFLSYVTAAGDGLMYQLCVVDVREVTKPALTGCLPRFSGDVRRIQAGETAVYVSVAHSLYMVDTAEPQTMRHMPLGFPVWNVVEDDEYVYIAGGPAGLLVWRPAD